jgi:hypothetical protein
VRVLGTEGDNLGGQVHDKGHWVPGKENNEKVHIRFLRPWCWFFNNPQV